MSKVIGYVCKSGTYEGRDYSNYLLQCVGAIDPKYGKGQGVEIYKVSAKRFSQVSQFSLDDLLNKEIEVFYDKYGQVSLIKLVR